jgi:hypothetical protein
MIPPVGSVIRVSLKLTSGEVTRLSGQQLYIVGTLLDDAGAPASLTITITETISNGAAPEDTESIRRNAHYSPVYNDSLVWAEDYKFFIMRHFPTIVWLNVWGEQEQEQEVGHMDVDFINKIYVSAHRPELSFTRRGEWAENETYETGDVVTYGPASQKWICSMPHLAADPPVTHSTYWNTFAYPLATEIPAKLAELHLMNREIEWVDPYYSTFSLTITGEVRPVSDIGTVQAEIRNLLNVHYGRDSENRRARVHINDIYDLINDTGHFADERAWFNVTASGSFEDFLLAEMVAIDDDATTINLDYF